MRYWRSFREFFPALGQAWRVTSSARLRQRPNRLPVPALLAWR